MPERIPNGVAKRVVFRAIASSDHFTPATGKTIAITISKNAGAFGNLNAGATNATEITSGFYYFDLGTADSGTNGPLAWRGAGTGIDDVGDVYEVVAATNGGFSALPAVASGSAGAVITSGTGTAQLSVSAGLVTLAGVTHTGAVIPTVTTLTGHTAQTGDAYARLGAPAGASVSADVAAVKAQTAAIETDTGTDLPATLSTIAGYLDTEIAAIKAKTDSLTFTTAGLVDANVQQINDVTITGNGQVGTEFGV